MPGDLVHLHVRLSPDAATAWAEAAEHAGTTVAGLMEAVGRRRIRAISREQATAATARTVVTDRKKRPGPRNRKRKAPA